MEYVVASDDYRPLKHTQILNHKDGTSEEASKMEFSYGVDRPEDVADLCEKYEEAEKAEGDVRNVTVIAAPRQSRKRIMQSRFHQIIMYGSCFMTIILITLCIQIRSVKNCTSQRKM